MKAGDVRTVEVPAKERWFDTGIDLLAGEVYELSVSGTWLDKTEVSGPEGYVAKVWWLWLLQLARRRPCRRTFALMGAIEGRWFSGFYIGRGTTLRVRKAGRLLCFANDVYGFYCNNEGSVTLSMRVGGGEGGLQSEKSC